MVFFFLKKQPKTIVCFAKRKKWQQLFLYESFTAKKTCVRLKTTSFSKRFYVLILSKEQNTFVHVVAVPIQKLLISIIFVISKKYARRNVCSSLWNVNVY